MTEVSQRPILRLNRARAQDESQPIIQDIERQLAKQRDKPKGLKAPQLGLPVNSGVRGKRYEGD